VFFTPVGQAQHGLIELLAPLPLEVASKFSDPNNNRNSGRIDKSVHIADAHLSLTGQANSDPWREGLQPQGG
jgi:hypothetical protein